MFYKNNMNLKTLSFGMGIGLSIFAGLILYRHLIIKNRELSYELTRLYLDNEKEE